MPTSQEVRHIKKIGLVAGGGDLPRQILADCKRQGIEVFIVGFDGQTDPDLVKDYGHLWTRLGAVGAVINTLKKEGVQDLILAGSIKRPGLLDLKPDLKAAKILARIGMMALGDNTLLTALRKELEQEGFFLHGVQRFSDHLLATEGLVGEEAPHDTDFQDIALGVKASQELGALDIGQSVVVQQGIVLAVEGAEGTDALIERCASLQKSGRGAILVKTCKPQQDRDLDLPTIGVDTVIKAHKAGFAGIVIHAGHCIVLDIKAVAELADQYKMFVFGVRPEEILSVR